MCLEIEENSHKKDKEMDGMSLLEKLYLRQKNNLAHFDQKLEVYNRNWYEYHRDELTQKEFDFMLVDLNNLKFINDTYGHSMGDEVLQVMVGIAKAIYHREDDYIVRLGGDEFLVLSPNYYETRLVKYLPMEHFSYGVVHHNPGDSLDSCFKEADEKMYEMKKLFHKKNPASTVLGRTDLPNMDKK